MTQPSRPSAAQRLLRSAEAFLVIANLTGAPAEHINWHVSSDGIGGVLLDDDVDDDERRAIITAFAAALGVEVATSTYAPLGDLYAGATALDVDAKPGGVTFRLWTLVDRVELVKSAAEVAA